MAPRLFRDRRWQRDGTWARVLAGLQAVADVEARRNWRVGVDSTISPWSQPWRRSWPGGMLEDGGADDEAADEAFRLAIRIDWDSVLTPY